MTTRSKVISDSNLNESPEHAQECFKFLLKNGACLDEVFDFEKDETGHPNVILEKQKLSKFLRDLKFELETVAMHGVDMGKLQKIKARVREIEVKLMLLEIFEELQIESSPVNYA